MSYGINWWPLTLPPTPNLVSIFRFLKLEIYVFALRVLKKFYGKKLFFKHPFLCELCLMG